MGRPADSGPGGEGPVQPMRAVIADDDPLARRIVRDALQAAGITVAADAKNGREAVELALHYRPDVVVMDVVMPELDGISAARKIREHAPEVKILILSMSDDDEIALLGLRAGASGYLSKDIDVVRLPQILEGVVSGEAAVTRRFTAKLIEELRRVPAQGTGVRPVRSNLSSREWEVLDLIAAGQSPDQVADTLVISVETVRSHEKSLRRKLDVRSRAELVAAVGKLRRPASHFDGSGDEADR